MTTIILGKFQQVDLNFSVVKIMSQWREEVKLLHEVTFDNKPPETCLEFFEGSLNFVGLPRRIQNADRQWIEEFLGLGGLEKLFKALTEISGKTSPRASDAVQELECTLCIKSIMNHKLGMEHVIKTEEKFIDALTEGK